jgi:hypothetical protein
MDASVPSHIDESDESSVASSANPTETVPVQLAMPVVGEEPMPERLGV